MRPSAPPPPKYAFGYRTPPTSGNAINGLGEREASRARKVFHSSGGEPLGSGRSVPGHLGAKPEDRLGRTLDIGRQAAADMMERRTEPLFGFVRDARGERRRCIRRSMPRGGDVEGEIDRIATEPVYGADRRFAGMRPRGE